MAFIFLALPSFFFRIVCLFYLAKIGQIKKTKGIYRGMRMHLLLLQAEGCIRRWDVYDIEE